MTCNICDIVQLQPIIKDFGNYAVVKHADGKYYCIWKAHKAYGDIKTCKSVFTEMKYNFECIVRQEWKGFGMDIVPIPHMHFIAWRTK